jgi:hypothetical protein
MKYTALLILTFGVILFGCNNQVKSKSPVLAKVSPETKKLPEAHNDKEEITALIRQMLKWADSKNTIDLLPALSKDSICIGFDLSKLRQNDEELRKTSFFAEEFIRNYDQIIQTLDKKTKNREFEKWNVYDLPSFTFTNDITPWCSCQEYFAWDKVEVEPIKLDKDKGELKWRWGADFGRNDQGRSFRVVKVDNKWKISYLQGFDYKESTKRDY